MLGKLDGPTLVGLIALCSELREGLTPYEIDKGKARTAIGILEQAVACEDDGKRLAVQACIASRCRCLADC